MSRKLWIVVWSVACLAATAIAVTFLMLVIGSIPALEDRMFHRNPNAFGMAVGMMVTDCAALVWLAGWTILRLKSAIRPG